MHGHQQLLQHRHQDRERENRKSIKYLSVMIDNKLNLKSHVDYVSKKAAKKIGFLAKISKNLNSEHKIATK